jgi:hypothetical protein
MSRTGCTRVRSPPARAKASCGSLNTATAQTLAIALTLSIQSGRVRARRNAASVKSAVDSSVVRSRSGSMAVAMPHDPGIIGYMALR